MLAPNCKLCVMSWAAFTFAFALCLPGSTFTFGPWLYLCLSRGLNHLPFFVPSANLVAPFASLSKPEEDINLLAPDQKAVLSNSDVEGVLFCVLFRFFSCYSQNIQKLVRNAAETELRGRETARERERYVEWEVVKRLPTACLPPWRYGQEGIFWPRDRSVACDKMLHIYVRN